MRYIVIESKNGVRENYGFLAIDFAEEVEKIGITQILQMHESATAKIFSMMKDPDSLSERIALKMASIYVTAEIIKQKYDNHIFDMDNIINYLIEAEAKARETRSLDEQSLEQFKDFVRQNKNHFDIYTNGTTTKHNSGEIYGAIIISKKEKTINILKPIFNKFLENNKISERLSILRTWKCKKEILCENDRYDIHVSVLGNARAYKFLMTSDEAEFFMPNVHEYIPPRFEVSVPLANLDEITYESNEDGKMIFNEGENNENKN